MRLSRLTVVIAMLGLVAGCGETSSSPAPTHIGPPVQPSPPAPPAPPPVTRPTATLVIEQGSLRLRPLSSGPAFEYEPRFQLREISGKSGATIQNVFLGLVNGGGDNTGPGCWQDALRVPSGGTLDTFYTDEGYKWLGYCGVWSTGSSETPTLQLIVTFTDDDGVTGTVEAILHAATRF